MSGTQGVNGTAIYTLTARDQSGNPISGYQFGLKLEIRNNNQATIEENTVNGSVYSSMTTEIVDVSPSDVGLTDTDGKVSINIHWISNGTTDLYDYARPLWYDANENIFGQDSTKFFPL